jgi:protein AroM
MLALVTIGQAPRDDVARAMFGADPPRLIQTGALDVLDAAMIAEIAPRAGEQVLVSRLRDGREVALSKPRLIPHLHDAIARAETAGASVICVLCTGTFPELLSRARLVFPDRVLDGAVTALAPDGALGVLMPHTGQAEMMRKKWSRSGRRLALATASPYASDGALERSARELETHDVDLVVMDCMGYDRAMQAQVRSLCGAPVVLVNGLVGAVLRETTSSTDDWLE